MMPTMPAQMQERQDRQIKLLEEQTKRLEVLIMEHELAIEKFLERIDVLRNEREPMALLAQSQIEFLILNTRAQIYQYTQQLDGSREMAESMRNPVYFNYGMPMHMPVPPSGPVRVIGCLCDGCGTALTGDDGIPVMGEDPREVNRQAHAAGWEITVTKVTTADGLLMTGLRMRCKQCQEKPK